jgi:RND family efflux transporter MFP subunit
MPRVPGLLLCLFAAGVSACGGREADGSGLPADSLEVPAVEAVQSREGVVPLRERLTGTVRAAGEVAIFPDASGPVVEVMAQNGDAVTKGDPLVRIQTAGSGAQLTQSRSQLEAARGTLQQTEARHRELAAEYERQRELGKQGLVPLNTVESLRAQVEAARAGAAAARAQVDSAAAAVSEQREVQAQSTVRAPITGRVGQRNVEVGMRVDTQTPLFVIGRLENMRVEVPVTQDVLTRVKPGQRVELRVGGAAQRPIEAAVSRVSPFLAAGSFSAEVEVDVPNDAGTLVPGMFVTVDIFYGESEPATLIPTSALYENPATGERGVYVAAGPPPPVPAATGTSGGDAVRPAPMAVPFRPLDVVAEAAQTIGVTGLKPGEWVVVVGQHLLAGQGAESVPQARVRPMTWDQIMEMQHLQRDDLLREFMERQQRGAAAAGSGS